MMPVAQGLHGRVTYIDSRKGGPRQAALEPGPRQRQRPGAVVGETAPLLYR